MSEKLEACPFCGHSAALDSVGADHFVMCDGCCAETPRFQSPTGDASGAIRHAIAAWNRRAAPRAMGASAERDADEFAKQLRSKASMARMAAAEIDADYEPDDPADIAAGLEFDAEMNEKAADLIEALLAQAAPIASAAMGQVPEGYGYEACTGDNPGDVRANVRANEILADHASRLAFELECCLFDNERFFNQACAALDAYKADVELLYPSLPTFLGEPIPAERAERYRKMRAERAAAQKDDKSDCHGPDWTERDGEYLK